MVQLVGKPGIGFYLLFLMLAMGIPRLVSAQSPDAVLVKTIDISAGGAGPRMRMGDLNGDGRLDILMVQATNDTPSFVAMLTAYDGFTGKQLWQVGKDSGVTGTDRDEPCQVYDIDNDGNNEVLAVMTGVMNIYNGADGTLKKSFPIPAASAHDAIIIANFSKNPVPQDIVLKDRYGQAWAIDKDGKLLWTYSGITGHYPWPYDADGDGRDELFIGYNQLDYLGKPKYTAPFNQDHPDCMWLGDVDGNPANGFEVVYGLATSPSCQAVSTSTGKVVWANSDNRESQQIMLGDFRPDLPGLEVYGNDRVNRSTQDALFVLSSTGEQLWKEIPDNSGFGTALKLVRNWDGSNTPMCLALKRGGGILPEVRDGKGVIIHRMPMDGNAVVGDFGGDSKQEVLMYSRTAANIYAFSQFDYNQPAPNPGHPLRQNKEYYNYSRYGSGDVDSIRNTPGQPDGGAPSTGGVGGTGGASGGASGTAGATGGTTRTGGATGGTSRTGGAGPGGTTGPGGATATGGTPRFGTGGTTTASNTTSPGISSAVGGSSAVPTGGIVAVGGVPDTGGAIVPTGGTTNAGGSPSSSSQAGGTPAGTGSSQPNTGPGPIATGGTTAGTQAAATSSGCSCNLGATQRGSGLSALGSAMALLLVGRRRRRCV